MKGVKKQDSDRSSSSSTDGSDERLPTSLGRFNSLSSLGSTISVAKCTLLLQDESVAERLRDMYDEELLEAIVKGVIKREEVHAVAAINGEDVTRMRFSSVLQCLQSICINNMKPIKTGTDSSEHYIVFIDPRTGKECNINLQEGFAPNSAYLDIADQVAQTGYVAFESLNHSLFDMHKLKGIRAGCIKCCGMLTAIGMDKDLLFWAARCSFCNYVSGQNPTLKTAACVWPGEDFTRLIETTDTATNVKEVIVSLKPLQFKYQNPKEYAEIAGPLMTWEGSQEKDEFENDLLVGKIQNFASVGGVTNKCVEVTVSAPSKGLWTTHNYYQIGKIIVEIIPTIGSDDYSIMCSKSFMLFKDEKDPSKISIKLLIEEAADINKFCKEYEVHLTPKRNKVLYQAMLETLSSWWENSSSNDTFITRCILNPTSMMQMPTKEKKATLKIADPYMETSYNLMAKFFHSADFSTITKCLVSDMTLLDEQSGAGDVNVTCTKVLVALQLHFSNSSTLIVGSTPEACDAFSSAFTKTMRKMWCGRSPFTILRVLPFKKAVEARGAKRSTEFVHYLHEVTDDIIRLGSNQQMKDIQKRIEENTFWSLDEFKRDRWMEYIRKFEFNQMESTNYRVIATTMEAIVEYGMHNLFKKNCRSINSIIILDAGSIPQVKLTPLSAFKKVDKLITTVSQNYYVDEPLTKTGKLAGFNTTIIDCIQNYSI